MAVVVNHNISALNAANNLTQTYANLAKSVSRLSSGLRIVSAEDDAAGLAVRELMRSDVRVLDQGVRNAQDAINMLMTADGAMGVIDEKLIRMKELAEQAATGTYTTAQREIMNDEFLAMADEITRIANATDFNGIKLIDGTLSALHSGLGAKIHFGTGNSSAEDYYYVNLGNLTATSLLGSGQIAAENVAYAVITAATFSAADTALTESGFFGFYYNNDGTGNETADPATLSDLAGIYQVTSTMSLNDIASAINQGTMSRATFTFDSGSTAASAATTVTIGSQTYEFVSAAGDVAAASHVAIVMGASAAAGSWAASALMNAINTTNNGTNLYATMSGETQYAFTVFGSAGATAVSANQSGISVAMGDGTTAELESGGSLNGGGSAWITASVRSTSNADGSVTYQLLLTGARANAEGGSAASYYIAGVTMGDMDYFSTIASTSFTTNFETGGSSTDWAVDSETQFQDGLAVDISTQSGAQAALSVLDEAIISKDQARAEAGATINRLENTVTALTVQAENLQASESAISDADIAAEMTEFTKNLILAQSGVAMLAQANSVANLALSLLG